MIDRIRQDIQERLDQLLAEIEKLRHALAELDPRERQRAQSAARSKSTPASKTRAAKPTAARTRTQAASSGGPSTRTAPGATKTKVLAALSSSNALTAGELAKATGLGRATVSTTLSKLAKSGEVTKAKRGYRLP